MKLQKRILTFAAAAMLALSMALPCAAAESAMDHPSAHRPGSLPCRMAPSW